MFPPFFSSQQEPHYDHNQKNASPTKSVCTGRRPKVASGAMVRIALANTSACFFAHGHVGESVWIALANTSALFF
jgi:hypothetical protein